MTPPTEQSRVETVTRLLGSYWAGTYQDAAGVADLSRAVVWALDEIAFRLDEARACLAVDTVPAFAVPRWLPLTRLPNSTAAPPYDSAAAGDYRAAGSTYGLGASPAAFAPVWGEVVECPLVCEFAGGGGRTWVSARDYRLVEGELLFDADPQVLQLWAFEPRLDAGYTVDAFGAAGGVREPASYGYAEFVRALLAQAAGDTGAGLNRLVCAAFDVPAVGDAPETVEEVVDLGDRAVVVTDVSAYPAVPGDGLPSAGDELRPGSAADGSISFTTYRGPQDEPPESLHLDAGLCLSGPLTFGPGDQVAGDPAVVARFERDASARQDRYALTLTRATEGRPLTQTELLLRELLRYAAAVVEVSRPTSRGSVRLAACRPVMPVHAALIVLLRALALSSGGPAGGGTAPPPLVAATPAVDSGPLVGYSLVSLTPFGC